MIFPLTWHAAWGDRAPRDAQALRRRDVPARFALDACGYKGARAGWRWSSLFASPTPSLALGVAALAPGCATALGVTPAPATATAAATDAGDDLQLKRSMRR